MYHLDASRRYFLYRHATDMRKGFDGLCGHVRDGLQKDPLGGDVFVFLNKRRTHLKALCWEGDGFSLYYKRLERGTYELPRSMDACMAIPLRRDELMLMLHGISLQYVRRRERFAMPNKTNTENTH